MGQKKPQMGEVVTTISSLADLCRRNSMVAYDTDVGSDPGTDPGLVEAFRRTIGNSNTAYFSD